MPEMRSEAKPKRRGSAWIVLLVILAVAAVGLAIFAGVYYSEGKRIERAEAHILCEQYDEALEEMDGIYTPETDAMREYIELWEKCHTFLETYKTGQIVTDAEHETCVALSELVNAVYTFEGNDWDRYLPRLLSGNYQRMRDTIFAVDGHLSGLNSTAYSAQCVYKVGIVKNIKDEFTLSELQGYVDSSKTGIQDFKEKYSAEAVHEALGLDVSEQYSRMSAAFIENIEQKISTEQKSINNESKKFGWNSPLHLKNPNSSYKAQFTDTNAFVYMRTEEDFHTNADRLYYTLRCGLIAEDLEDMV